MTCIVGLEHNGDVYIGGDSAGVRPDLSVVIRADEKVFVRGDMIFGFCGSYRVGQILRYSFNPPPQIVGQDDYAYLCSTWVDSLIECLKSKGCAVIREGELEVTSNGDFLIGFNGSLYEVQDNFQISRVAAPYVSCGCASYYALGAMAMIIDDDIAPEEKITKALEVAEMFSAGVRSPFVIERLDGDEIDFTFTGGE